MNFRPAAAALTRLPDIWYFFRAQAPRMYFVIPMRPMQAYPVVKEKVEIVDGMCLSFASVYPPRPDEKLKLVIKGTFPDNRWQGKIKSAEVPAYNIFAEDLRGRVWSPRSTKSNADFDLTNDEMCLLARTMLEREIGNEGERARRLKRFNARAQRYSKFAPTTPGS